VSLRVLYDRIRDSSSLRPIEPFALVDTVRHIDELQTDQEVSSSSV